MDTLIHVLKTALPVFTVILVGMLARSKRLLTEDGVAALKRVAADITLPMVLFEAFATAEYTREAVTIPLVIFVLCCVALGLGVVLCRLLKVKSRLTPFLMTGFEAGMLGYGLFALLFPDAPRSAFAITDLGQVLFVFTLYRVLLTGDGGMKAALRAAVTSPVLWAIGAGLICGATGLFRAMEPSGVAGVVTAVTQFISAPTSVLILLSIGYGLVFSQVRWGVIIRTAVMRVAVAAAVLGLALLANQYLLGNAMHTGALILLCILPPPFMLPVFTDVPEERADVSASLSLLTCITLALFTMLAAVFR